jgi:hypothetical protein
MRKGTCTGKVTMTIADSGVDPLVPAVRQLTFWRGYHIVADSLGCLLRSASPGCLCIVDTLFCLSFPLYFVFSGGKTAVHDVLSQGFVYPEIPSWYLLRLGLMWLCWRSSTATICIVGQITDISMVLKCSGPPETLLTCGSTMAKVREMEKMKE